MLSTSGVTEHERKKKKKKKKRGETNSDSKQIWGVITAAILRDCPLDRRDLPSFKYVQIKWETLKHDAKSKQKQYKD